MPNKVSSEVAREHERRAWELRQQLLTHAEIAAKLGVERSSVTKMLDRVEKRYLKEQNARVELMKAEQTGQHEYIAGEAMSAWNEQKDSRYLVAAMSALSALRDIWGIDTSKKQEHSGSVALSLAEWRNLAAERRVQAQETLALFEGDEGE